MQLCLSSNKIAIRQAIFCEVLEVIEAFTHDIYHVCMPLSTQLKVLYICWWLAILHDLFNCQSESQRFICVKTKEADIATNFTNNEILAPKSSLCDLIESLPSF